MRFCDTGRRALACALAVAVSSCAPSPPVEAVPAAQPIVPDRRVGAVFLGGDAVHLCSGAVLATPAGDLILTAAHCLADGVGARFVAGFDGVLPAQDVGAIDAVYLDPRWVRDQDPAADYAIARVQLGAGDSVEGEAGGGLRLGTAPRPGTAVTVTGYASGSGGPTSCVAPIAIERQGFPSLNCDGLVAGFSGAPWIDGATVRGLVGGLDGGGCLDEVSYSPPFGDAVAALLARAEAGGPGDRAPTVFDDGCGE